MEKGGYFLMGQKNPLAALSNFGCPKNFFHLIISILDSMQSYYINKQTFLLESCCIDLLTSTVHVSNAEWRDDTNGCSRQIPSI